MRPQLTDPHQRTCDCISRHPAVRNPGWRDVRTMLSSLTEAVREPNVNVKVTRDGQASVLGVSLDKKPY